MAQMPTGLGIIGMLHAFSALFLIIHVIFSIPFVILTFTEDLGLGAIATLESVWGLIMVGIHSAIAGAIFSRKSWAILAINFLASIGFIFAILDGISGNMFAVFSIFMYGIVIIYIRKESVHRWLNDAVMD